MSDRDVMGSSMRRICHLECMKSPECTRYLFSQLRNLCQANTITVVLQMNVEAKLSPQILVSFLTSMCKKKKLQCDWVHSIQYQFEDFVKKKIENNT